MDFTETYKAMEECVTLGLAKSLGLSNFNSEQIDKILAMATVKPVVNQVECHVYFNQKKLIQFCKERGIVVIAYSPLGAPGGMFTERDCPNLLQDVVIKSIALQKGRTPAQIALRYLMQCGVAAIPKSVNKSRLRDNINIFDFTLTPLEMAAIDALNLDNRLVPFLGADKDRNYPFNIPF